MTYIFISPNYPSGHWRYVASLRAAGHDVYGIGDAGIETFPAELRGNLNEYYRVGNLHDYNEVYKGCCYFISRFGRFDRVESLNPYWCDLVAAVRHDFLPDIVTQPGDEFLRSNMKLLEHTEQYDSGLLPVSLPSSWRSAVEAAEKLGYPVLALPLYDKSIGRRIIDNDIDLKRLFRSQPKESIMLRGQYKGERVTVDGLSMRTEDGNLRAVACSVHAFCEGEQRCSLYCLPMDDAALLRINTLINEQAIEGFFHLDCVKLDRGVRGRTKKGDIMINDFTLSPPHEFIIDCLNIEYDCDLRGIWAVGTPPAKPLERKLFSAVACRGFERSYKNTHERILRRLAAKLILHGITGETDREGYLNYHYIFSGADSAELRRHIKYITEDHAPCQ